jgi:hypothetical protein
MKPRASTMRPMARRRRRRRRARPRLRGLALLLVALAVLVLLHHLGIGSPAPVSEAPGGDYDRRTWPHWVDDDGDCQDTRAEVLIAESAAPVHFADADRCRVTRGRWRCPYTGRIVTDASELDVDHLVPLSAAHASGGHAWTRSRRRAFANSLEDPEHLIAVDASANRQKGDKGPDRWLPPDPAARCDYVRAWSRIKARWDLEMSPAEQAAVTDALGRCARGGVPPAPH